MYDEYREYEELTESVFVFIYKHLHHNIEKKKNKNICNNGSAAAKTRTTTSHMCSGTKCFKQGSAGSYTSAGGTLMKSAAGRGVHTRFIYYIIDIK